MTWNSEELTIEFAKGHDWLDARRRDEYVGAARHVYDEIYEILGFLIQFELGHKPLRGSLSLELYLPVRPEVAPEAPFLKIERHWLRPSMLLDIGDPKQVNEVDYGGPYGAVLLRSLPCVTLEDHATLKARLYEIFDQGKTPADILIDGEKEKLK